MRQLYVMEKLSLLPKEKRPREKLLRRGVAALSDLELVALMIGSGTRKAGVEALTSSVLDILDRNNAIIAAEDLTAIPGIGKAKSALILAALEFSRRRLCPGRKKIGFPRDVLPLISHFSDRKQEHFLCLSLNGAHEVITVRVVSIGLVNRALVHPREVFADPLSDRAAAVIIAHNHPSDNLDPSPEDRQVTARLKAAAELLGLGLLDHVIFGKEGYYSFLEKGEL